MKNNVSEKYIFDFDGTLVDSMKYWAGRHIKALEDGNIKCPDNFVEIITPLGNIKASEYAISLGLDISLEQYLKKLNGELFEDYSTRVELKNNVSETLSVLKSKGYSLNVLTASPHSYMDGCLQRLGVYGYFDNVWSIDDFQYTKSNVLIYKETAERLETSTESCIFVDDNYIAINTAHNAGMQTIAVYDETSKSYIEKLKKTADKYIFDFGEIIE